MISPPLQWTAALALRLKTPINYTAAAAVAAAATTATADWQWRIVSIKLYSQEMSIQSQLFSIVEIVIASPFDGGNELEPSASKTVRPTIGSFVVSILHDVTSDNPWKNQSRDHLHPSIVVYNHLCIQCLTNTTWSISQNIRINVDENHTRRK